MTHIHRKIEIPFGKGDEVLELEVANLPEPAETAGILQEQDCKINLWIQIAIEYYRQGKFDAFELLLSRCLSSWPQDRIKENTHNYPEGDKDRTKALDLLAVFYVRRGYASKNRERRRDYYSRAAQKFTEVDRSEFISISNTSSEYQYHLLGRAYCCLYEGRSEQADAQFNFVMQQQQQAGEPENVPTLLGRACIEFNKKEASGKRAALQLYKKAIQVCPNCPADVRLGLGICYYKLNMPEKAEEAFSRAYSLDPQCVGALTGLAVMELNKKTAASIQRGMNYLSRAYKIEPTDPMILTLLADHYFWANEHEKVIKLATRALENTENEAMQAQACYQLGRAYHKQHEFDKAFEYYYKATQFGGSSYFLAHYGLAQMYIHRKEYESAIQSLEAVLTTNPDNHETLKILASLYANSNSQSKSDLACKYLKKVTENRPDDVEAWVELASLTEQHDGTTALNAYQAAIKLYEARSEPVPPELYNNMAALLFAADNLEEAEQYYNLAIDRCQEMMHPGDDSLSNEEFKSNELHYGSIIYTIKYNVGRLYEAKHQLEAAENTYKSILVQHPMYIDCYLRLGCMERDKGLLFDASDKFKETFRINPDNFEAWTLIGNLHLSKLELTPCQKKFERILDITRAKPDLYSMISVGNVWLQSQYQPIKDVERQRQRALLFYNKALKHDPKNIYAASGIGCILAIKGLYNEARDVFSQVREATADFPDVWINIAHIYVEQKQYVPAVQMYENCHKKFYNNSNTDILSYIARALFKANKLHECKKTLLKARHIKPHDLGILFNLARVLKALARQVFEDRKSTYRQVVWADFELKQARMYFKFYSQMTKDRAKSENSRGLIEYYVADKEERECADLLLQVEKSVKVDAEQRDREESQRRAEHVQQLSKELERKAEEERKRKEEEQAKREEQDNKRRELLKKQEEAKQKMLQEDTAPPIIDDGSDEGEGSRPKKRKKTGREGKEGRKKERSERDQERDLERADKNKKYKSRAIVPSSDESSSDSEGALVD